MKRDVIAVALACGALIIAGGTWLACIVFGWEAGIASAMLAVGYIGALVAREKHKRDKKAPKCSAAS